MTDRVIITIRNGVVAAVHAHKRLRVAIINEDIPRNGDAAYVAGLKHETETMLQVYPENKSPSQLSHQ